MFHSLMVALDGTPFGEHALPLAVALARHTGASLELAHVHVPQVAGGTTTLVEDRAYLESQAEKVRSRIPHLEVRTALLADKDATALADVLAHHADISGVDLIVLNSHARGGLARWWLGNVAEDLVRRTSLPILVTPSLEKDAGWEVEPKLRHILIALDGSPLAEQVLPTALNLGECMESEFTLFRVVEPAPVPVVDPAVAPAAAYDPGLAERQLTTAENYLHRIATRLMAEDPALRMRTRLVVDPEPAEAICGFLNRRPRGSRAEGDAPPSVDLIALATHGREGLTRLLLGSTADRVLHHTPVPLLLQHPAAVPAEREATLV